MRKWGVILYFVSGLLGSMVFNETARKTTRLTVGEAIFTTAMGSVCGPAMLVIGTAYFLFKHPSMQGEI